jgi:16S rRNA G966 N2-methylase RsmD
MKEDFSINELLEKAWKYESGRRLLPYDVFKWWGRRPALFIQALLLDSHDTPLNDLNECVAKRLSHESYRVLKDLTICDPMCGGGTACIEALFLGARKIICSDIDPSSVLVVKATLKIMSEKCTEIFNQLYDALMTTVDKTKNLWCINEYCYVHTFLTRECYDDFCIVPRWLGIRRKKNKVVKVSITEDGDIVEDANVGINEKIAIPSKNLVKINEGVYAYASELYRPLENKIVERVFVSLIKNPRIATHLAESQERSRSLLEKSCMPIPEHKETKRLKKNGVVCWEELFTPRQLLTLKLFLEEVNNINSSILDVATAMIGTAIRTLSLLAFYYQPYGKINPGLIIKSYWLPKYPAELNPLAADFKNMKTIGRGTLLTYLKKISKACELYKHQNLNMNSVIVESKNAYEVSYIDCDVVILDPPYPSKIDYDAMSLVYDVARGLIPSKSEVNQSKINGEGIDVHDLDTYINQLLDLLRKITMELKDGGKVYLLLSEDENGQKVIEAVKSELEKLDTSLSIEEKGSFTSEAPGVLGRSRTKRIIVLKIVKNKFQHYNKYIRTSQVSK